MKKLGIIITIVLLFFAPIKAFAVEDYQSQIDQIAQEKNIDTDKLMDIRFSDILSYITNQLKENASQPIKLFYRVCAITILCSLLKLFAGNTDKGITDVINALCVVVIFLNLLQPFKALITAVTTNMGDLKNFMTTFLPVYSGISMASGEFVTSTIYTGFFLLSLIFISDFCVKFILPTINLYLAVTVTNSVSSGIRLKSLCDFYLKSVKWLMRSMVSVICFILTIQTTITQGQDNLAVKAGKMVVSNAVPIIGSALEDAVSSVYASMEVVKGFAGAVGVLGVLYIFLPVIITLILYWLCTGGMIIVSDVLDNDMISGILSGFQGVVELLMSIVFLFLILLIFSMTIMIKLTQGV